MAVYVGPHRQTVAVTSPAYTDYNLAVPIRAGVWDIAIANDRNQPGNFSVNQIQLTKQ
jgi:hypothetical protein